MKIVRYKNKYGRICFGLVKDKMAVDIADIYQSSPSNMADLLALWPNISPTLEKRLGNHAGTPISELELLPPIEPSSRIICVGLNYSDHAAEGKMSVPEHPVFFTRYYSSMVGAGADMVRPRLSDKYDYEAELAVVIGRQARHVSKQDALAYVAGYTICNDGSVRDYQKRNSQWTLGKNFDSSGAIGPWIVTSDELPEAARGLKICSRLNGSVMQSDNTANMIFDVPTLIESLTEVMTLMPGDIISTGTPAGVGFAREPRVWLKPDDVIEIEIEKIGALKNQIIAE